LYVLLNTDPTTDPDRPHEREYDRTSELIQTLREQLEAERQAHAEARRLLAAALERIPPAIEAPRDARESPLSADEESDRPSPPRCPRHSGGRTEAVVEEVVREMTT
jgi:predicted  nucleic acid-binding Zn-ribbon protein